ncbi:MAG: choice-of-anchor J domain-containing protein [Euryarchaeota archaeon]|nr:choice-of-anchor J domain-containing protein [Euryarchaeota archaeon]
MKIKSRLLKASVICVTFCLILLSTANVSANKQSFQPLKKTITSTQQIIPQKLDKGSLLSEGFEGGELPEGWSVLETNSYQNWFIGTDPAWAHTGNCEAWVNYDNHEDSDEWLITPNLDLAEYVAATIVFWVWSDTNFPGATAKLHIRGTGFDDIIWDLIQDENWTTSGWYELSFNLTNYIGKTINISWQYVGFNGQSFGVDDIEIQGTPASEPALQITSITGPIGIKATIENTGTADATNVQWSINLDGGFILLGKSKAGEEPTIPVNSSIDVKIPLILGFGKTIIHVVASCAEGVSTEKTQNATVLLIFVSIK